MTACADGIGHQTCAGGTLIDVQRLNGRVLQPAFQKQQMAACIAESISGSQPAAKRMRMVVMGTSKTESAAQPCMAEAKTLGICGKGVVQRGGSGNRKFYNADDPTVWQWTNTEHLVLSTDVPIIGHFEHAHNSLVQSAPQVRQWRWTSHCLPCQILIVHAD